MLFIKIHHFTGALLLFALLSCQKPPAKTRLEIWLGGDVHLGQGKKSVLSPLALLTKGAPGVVNLEGPVAPGESRSGEKVILLNAPHTLAELSAAGVRVAGIVNNHALDAGPSSLTETASALKGAGILPAGGPAGAAVLEAGGWKIVISAHDLSGGLPAALKEDLLAARRMGDLLISTFHVTGPPSYLPRPELKQAVEIALAAGAEVVAAHGTHSVGPVERRGDAVIAWGLGNLVFDCDCTNETDALLLYLSIDEQGIQAAVLPIEAGLKGEEARPAREPDGIFDLLEALGSSPLRREGNRAWL